jgi:hypothetical protein
MILRPPWRKKEIHPPRRIDFFPSVLLKRWLFEPVLSQSKYEEKK